MKLDSATIFVMIWEWHKLFSCHVQTKLTFISQSLYNQINMSKEIIIQWNNQLVKYACKYFPLCYESGTPKMFFSFARDA